MNEKYLDKTGTSYLWSKIKALLNNKAESTDLTSHTSATNNPHGVTKSQVGLGNVPNVTTNNQTPTYTVASINAELASGETLTTAFGKIAKAVKSLISHLGDTTVHITAAERTAWDAEKNATVASEAGANGLRYYNGVLQVKSGTSWVTIPLDGFPLKQ